ncbi:MAG TPA: hypothetical protein P5204_01880 [Kiritimatiellia bacterium]|nr:hypothetical protein [Kiritimatiellia bacterium]
MDEAPLQPPPAGRKKIRLTKSEAYAMQISSPRKKRIAFGAGGALVAAVLAAALWRFQDQWLPYWLPEREPAVPAAAPETAPSAEPVAADRAAPAAAAPAAPVEAPATLEFLTATAWDHPEFLRGVRLFNQALDRLRAFRRDGRPRDLLQQIEDGALQAATTFDQLRAQAPADVPLAEYVLRSRKLAQEARNLARPAALPAPAPAVAAPPPRPKPTAPPPKPGEAWQEPDYLEGARLFNQALEQYKRFLADKSQLDLLKPIEETAFQAAKKFESLQGLAPTNVPLGDNISQCYRLISDCRRQHLESGNAGGAADEETGARGKVVGPNRRPALPAYQPPAP